MTFLLYSFVKMTLLNSSKRIIFTRSGIGTCSQDQGFVHVHKIRDWYMFTRSGIGKCSQDQGFVHVHKIKDWYMFTRSGIGKCSQDQGLVHVHKIRDWYMFTRSGIGACSQDQGLVNFQVKKIKQPHYRKSSLCWARRSVQKMYYQNQITNFTLDKFNDNLKVY